MRVPLLVLVYFGLLALVLGCSLRPDHPGSESSRIGIYADRVREDRLWSAVEALSSIHSRYMHYDPGTAATLDYLTEILNEQGTPAQADSFSFFRFRWIETANLEVFFEGRSRPGRELVVGAHWDCLAYPESFQDSSARAPGADDNASGVAALLELARILRDLPLASSVRLIFFAGEEVGLKGSYHARERWSQPETRDSLICMLNVDMIGHDPDFHDASITSNIPSIPQALDALEGARKVVRALRLDFAVDTLTGSGGGSDHLPFWYNDLPAIWLQEGPEDRNPHANSNLDTLGLVSPDFLGDCTRILLGAVVELAGPIMD